MGLNRDLGNIPEIVKIYGSNVGINTSSDNGYKLEIGGTLKASGAITGNSFVKIGGTSSQLLTADGSVLTAGTGISISGGTISSTVTGGVTSFNTRTGTITLSSTDVTTALGYTPYNSTNPNGYISSYTETDPTVPSHVKAITATNVSNWSTAYTWGNHAAVGYLTSYTETDPTVPSHVKSITTTEKSNWNTAYGWGNHAGLYLGISAKAADSDLFDGIDSNRFIYGENSTGTIGITDATLNAALKSGFYTVGTGNIPNATSVNFVLHTSYNGVGNAAGFDLACNDSLTSQFYLRPATGGGKGSWQTIVTSANVGSYTVPTSRTITINGTSYDLSANRSWTVSGTDNTKLPLAGGTLTGALFVTTSYPYIQFNDTVSTTKTAYIQYGVTLGGAGTGGGGYLLNYSQDKPFGWTIGTTQGVMTIDTSGNVQALSSSRAPIFYDSNNTSYYFDGNGGTRQARFLTISGGTSGNYGNELVVGNTSVQYSLEDTNLRPIIQATGAYPVVSINHTVTSNGSHGATLQFTSNGVGNQFVIGSSGNGSRLDIGTSSNSSWNPHNGIDNYNGTTGLRMDTSGNIYNLVSTRSPIYYDNNDTGYYVDPASTSYMNSVNARGFITTGNPWGTGNSAWFPNGITTPSVTSWMYGTVYLGNAPGNGSGTEANSSGQIISTGDHRASVFYDYNNTGYYLDPAGSSNLDTINAARFASNQGSQNPNSSHPGYGIRPFYSWNIGQANNASAGYSNGISIGSHPGDQSYGFQIVQNMWDDQLYFRRYNGGWQGWRTALDNSNYSGYSNFGANAVYGGIFYDGHNTGYYVNPDGTSNMVNISAGGYIYAAGYLETSGAVYGTIFYDNNNRAYYMDPNGTSRMGTINADVLRSYNDIYMDNDHGHTVVGLYSAYRFQGVFAMGDAYKLPVGGGSCGNHYGIAWSHPYAGGEAAHLTDHGMLVQVAGQTRVAISTDIWCIASITAYSDARVKDNIKVIDNPLERIKKVRGVTYTRTDLEDTSRKFAGVIAQEMREALPEVVSEDSNGQLSVAYGNSIGLLIECVKEQQTQIEQLKELVNQLINK